MSDSPLGAELGRLAAPARPAPFDDVRLALVDAIIAAKAAGTLGQQAWEDAFGAAARSLRLRIIAQAEAGLRAAAARSRFPLRRLRLLLPDAESADTLLHRLLAEGMRLERLEGLADDAANRRARAAALELSWEGATHAAALEEARWRGLAFEVAAWRRPLFPVVVFAVLALAIATVAAGWLGGEFASPAWFRPINDAWWRLPWP